MDFSQNGLNLLKQLEAFKEHPYLDVAGHWTIGYGTRINRDDTGHFSIMSICEPDAAKILAAHAEHVAGSINRLCAVVLTQNQFDALVIFVYNIGEDAFANSTMLKLLNEHNYVAAANQFDRWVYAGKTVSEGLKSRRAAEKKLFMEGMT